ncbi:MAG TPA: hypothetical protein VKS25_04760 [Solirubrobacteraceae bacterium]|nr:hypothetical protein [Solirubrobacteraceae bacterium]
MSACPACGAAIGARQRWCLVCGSAALRRIATARRWGSAALLAAFVVALAVAGIGYAVATLASS